jgi:hypothetical protein
MLKEAAHAFVDEIRDRYIKHQLLNGGDKTPSEIFKLEDANTPAGTFPRLRRTKAGRRMDWKKKRQAQYDIALSLVRVITDQRDRMKLQYGSRILGKRGEQCDIAPQSWNTGAIEDVNYLTTVR